MMSSHYKTSSIEPWDVIEDWNLNFNLGNVIKYIARAEHKGAEFQDLTKALDYLTREVKRRGDGNIKRTTEDYSELHESTRR